MDELDGVWKVERLGGALPPLYRFRKRIHGARGTTELFGLLGVPFEVRGLELHYQRPLALLVDELERQEGGFLGRATLAGREIGRFTMRRLDAMGQLKEQLIKQIDEAYAMEQNITRMLDGLISTTEEPEILDALEHHRAQTEGHAERMRARLETHGATPSGVRQVGGILTALAKTPLGLVRGDNAGRTAREVYATEHMEIASYELLRRLADQAGDAETAAAAREIIVEEQAMADFVAERWETFADLSLREEGVTV